VAALWSGTAGPIDPSKFKQEMEHSAHHFKGSDQEDAQEFLRFLLRGIHEELNTCTVRPGPVREVPADIR